MKHKKKLILLVLALIAIIATLASCGHVQTAVATMHGDLIGNDYHITEYDDFGNKILQVNGDKIRMDKQSDTSDNVTSYITITIDGFEWKHVGSTLIFAQDGLEMITDFEIPEQITTDKSTSSGIMAVDRFVNSYYKNAFGYSQVVLIATQTGIPIGLFKGNSCTVTFPANMPKTTLVNIDGKLMYVHRANVDIIPTDMFEN